MKMYEQIGEFKPDSLIASQEYPILAEGIGLNSGRGILKRGSLILKGTDGAGYIAGSVVKETTGEGEGAVTSDMKLKVSGILTDDFDTGEEESADLIPATVYQTGIFNRAAVVIAGEDAAVEDYEDDMKAAGIYLRSVQKYE